jgi:PAS domain S-box-containing protein
MANGLPQRGKDAIRTWDRLLIAGIILILAGGFVLNLWMAQAEDNRLREDLLAKSRLVKVGFNAEELKGLTGTERDLSSPAYLTLKDQLRRVRFAGLPIRFMYFMRQRDDGAVIILVDSESPDSSEYSAPGEVYPEASEALKGVFARGTEITEGPSPDRWGTWVSSLTPITDPETGKVVAVFGMDVDAQDWNLKILEACFPVIIATLILLFLLLVFSYAHERNERERQILGESHRKVRESEHRLNDIINFLPDATFVIDSQGRVIAWNKAMEEMTGVGAGHVLGKGDYEYALPFYSERRPVLIDLVLEPDNVIISKYSGGVRRQGDMLMTETDTDLKRSDGSHAFLSARASPLRNVQGAIVGAIESIRDITFRKNAELELKTSEERLRLLLSNINDGILIHRISPEGPGRILDVNDRTCQILGYSRQELLQMSIQDLDVPEQRVCVVSLAEQLFTRKHILFETEYFTRSRQRVPVEISARLFEMDKKPTVLAIMRDITERRILEQKMEHHTEELHRFSRTLQQVNDKLNLMNRITRHDILNQLTAIVGYLDLMREKTSDPVLMDYIAIEIRAAKNIEEQIRFTKDYQDIGSQAPRWFDLRTVIRTAIEQLTIAPITLTVSIGLVQVFADPLFGKIFYTLIENTMRHGKNATEIRISCHEEDPGLVIVYEDNGTGVPAGHKEDIFDQKFFRHTGFGLFLSRTILGITGITIRESGEPGKGVRFEIVVPKGAYHTEQEL